MLYLCWLLYITHFLWSIKIFLVWRTQLKTILSLTWWDWKNSISAIGTPGVLPRLRYTIASGCFAMPLYIAACLTNTLMTSVRNWWKRPWIVCGQPLTNFCQRTDCCLTNSLTSWGAQLPNTRLVGLPRSRPLSRQCSTSMITLVPRVSTVEILTAIPMMTGLRLAHRSQSLKMTQALLSRAALCLGGDLLNPFRQWVWFELDFAYIPKNSQNYNLRTNFIVRWRFRLNCSFLPNARCH